MTAAPTILHDDDKVRVGAWGDVIFEAWRAGATAQLFRDLLRIEIAYASSQPDRKASVFSIIPVEGITLMDADARRELDARIKAVEPHLRATVILMPASGFGASIVRGIIAGVAQLTSRKVPMKVVASPEEGIRWLAPLLPAPGGDRISPLDLRRAYDAIVV
jgi:hypothetical protein